MIDNRLFRISCRYVILLKFDFVALTQHLIHDYCIYHCCTQLNLICLCIILDPSWVSYHMLLLSSSLARLSPLTVSPFLCPDQTSSNKLGLYDVSPPFLWEWIRAMMIFFVLELASEKLALTIGGWSNSSLLSSRTTSAAVFVSISAFKI